MLKIDTLVLGDYQTNCYIVRDISSKTCAVLDPGYHPETILSYLKSKNLEVDAILLTHGHFDHMGAVERIVEATDCNLWMSESDWSQPIDPLHTYFFPLANRNITNVLFCEDSEEITAGGLTFTVYTTPGHTSGSVCFLCENALFSGDTLFAGSCGRTDLPGGSQKLLQWSLERLAGLEDTLQVYPGHGPATTLAEEKQYNPYMRGML